MLLPDILFLLGLLTILTWAAVRVIYLFTPWPPTIDALIAGIGGALYIWGFVLYHMERTGTIKHTSWDSVGLALGVALIVLPKLFGIVARGGRRI